MARFDVYENPDAATRGEMPYLVDLQAPLLAGLSTRVVAPLFTEKPLAYRSAVSIRSLPSGVAEW